MYIVAQLPDDSLSEKTTILLFRSLKDAHKKAHILAHETENPVKILFVRQ